MYTIREGRRRGLAAGAVAATMLLAAVGASAQTAPPPGPPAYPPPPPRPPPGYYAPPIVQTVPELDPLYRRFSFTAAVGPGALFGPGEDAFAISYNLFRLGVGLAPRLQLVFGYEAVGTDSTNPLSGRDSWLQQSIWSLGLQYHVLRRLYVRGAMGFGYLRETTANATFTSDDGLALSGAVGYELLQTRHVAVGLEGAASTTLYPDENWGTTALQLAVSFF